ncbi:MAG: WD40 repeat domain-containing protein [Chloroflexi bacterium]|nr:WD40 repeat domain-containing protein [Chloroflexota bacterium]
MNRLAGLLLIVLGSLLVACTANQRVSSPMNSDGMMSGSLQMNHLDSITADNANHLIRVSQMGKGEAKCIAWSADGSELIVVTSQGIFAYSNPSFQLRDFKSLEINGDCVAITQNARYFGIYTASQELEVWNAEAGKVLQKIHVSSPLRLTSQDVLISSLGHWLAVRGRSEMELWDLATAKQVRTFGRLGKALAFDHTEHLIAFLGSNRQVEVCDIETWQQTQTLSALATQSISFSPNGEQLVTQTDGVAEVWDLQTTQAVLTMTVSPGRDNGLSNNFNGTWFMPDGKSLLSVNYSLAKLWNSKTAELINSLEHNLWLRQVAVSPDGQQVAILFHPDGGEIEIHELRTWKEIGRIAGHAAVADLDFHSHEPLLAIGWDADLTWLVDIEKGQTNVIRGQDVGHVSQVAFSPLSMTLAIGFSAGNGGGSVLLWDIPPQRLRKFVPTASVLDLAFSPDGYTLSVVAGGETRTLNVDSGEFDQGGCLCNHSILLLNPRTGLAAEGGVWGVVLHVASNLGYPLWTPQQAGDVVQNQVYSLAFNADGTWLAAGVRDGIHVWDVETRQEIQVYTDTQSLSIAFNPTGTLIASTNNHFGVDLWDTQERRLAFTIPVYRATRVAFSPDGTILAVGNSDGAVSLWVVKN